MHRTQYHHMASGSDTSRDDFDDGLTLETPRDLDLTLSEHQLAEGDLETPPGLPEPKMNKVDLERVWAMCFMAVAVQVMIDGWRRRRRAEEHLALEDVPETLANERAARAAARNSVRHLIQTWERKPGGETVDGARDEEEELELNALGDPMEVDHGEHQTGRKLPRGVLIDSGAAVTCADGGLEFPEYPSRAPLRHAGGSRTSARGRRRSRTEASANLVCV